MSIRSLLEQRARVVSDLRALTADGADMSDENRIRFDTLKTEADALQGKIDRASVVEDYERRMQGTPVAGSGDHRLDTEARNFSLVRAIAAQAGISGVDAGREVEISKEIARRSGRSYQGIAVPMQVFEQRVQSVGTNTAGGYLVSQDHLGNEYIDLLRKALVVRGMGARVLSGLRGNIEIPRATGSTTSGWVGENQPLTLSDMSFGSISMTPRTAGCITELSRNVLMQSSPDIEQLVRADFAAVLAETLDTAAINGSGTGATPRGVLNTPGIGDLALGANGLGLSYDNIADLMGLLSDANAEQGNLSFLSNSRVRRVVGKFKDGDGRPYGLDVVFQNMPRAFSNVVPSNLVKGSSGAVCSALIYGNWQDLILAYWSDGLELTVNPFEATAYSKGNVQVRGMISTDIAIRRPASFAAIKDILA